MSEEEVEVYYFVASCYFDELPIGTKFYTHNLYWSSPEEKITKRDVVHRGEKVRFPKPKSRHVYLPIPKTKFVDFCQRRNYKYKTPSTKLLIQLYNSIQ